MKRSILTLAALATMVVMACTEKKPSPASNEEGPKAETLKAEAQQPTEAKAAAATLDGVERLLGWSFGQMNVTKSGEEFVVRPNNSESDLVLRLKDQGDGTYQETSGKHDMIGQSATFKVQEVGNTTTLSAYQDDMLLFALVSGDDLKAFRDRGYKRILTSRFQPVDGEEVEISEDEMKVFLLPESPTMHYFFIEDGKGDLTDKIRLSNGRFFLYFAPADKGVNLHFCTLTPGTDELEVSYDDEDTSKLRYAKDPGWAWLSTDVLDSDFIIYNFDKPYWRLMLSKLKEKKQPTEIELWNRSMIENLIAHNDPYSALESTDE